jgi:Jacalin-like lectin domain
MMPDFNPPPPFDPEASIQTLPAAPRLEHSASDPETEPAGRREKPRGPEINLALPGTGPLLVGPSGGVGGEDFECVPLREGAAIREIHVRHDEVIRALGVGFVGAPPAAPRMFGSTEGQLSAVRLREGEYVTEIAGSYGTRVDSLEIVTNHGSFARFGGGGGPVPFRYHVPAGLELCGLGGRAGDAVDAIGLMFRARPGADAAPEPPELYRQGPAGDCDGAPFEDPPIAAASRITGVVVCHTYDAISGLGLEHEQDGETHLRFHGERTGETVRLALGPDEHIVGIGGSYWSDGIRGIYLVTNRRTTLTYGAESRYLPFMFKTKRFDDLRPGRYEIVGLLGRVGPGINALGVKFRTRI